MSCKERDLYIVSGANYGDEGKGLVTRALALKCKKEKRKPLVVLTNGGCQRGHTVDLPNNTRHVFHHFGSATLDDVETFISSYFVVNPQVFVKELFEIKELMPDKTPKVILDADCDFVTPFDIALNQHFELCLGENRHGSVGQGIWEAKHRENKIPVGMFRLLSKTEQKNYLLKILNEYVPKRKQEFYEDFNIQNPVEDKLLEIVSSDSYLEHWLHDFNLMMLMCFNVFVPDSPNAESYKSHYHSIFLALQGVDSFILENGQGLMLDEETGVSKIHCTHSSTGIRNATIFLKKYALHLALSNNNMIDLGDVMFHVKPYYVSRTYITKHGAGEFKEEDDGITHFEDKTNVPNDWQGTLRFGMLEQNELRSRITKDYCELYHDLADTAFNDWSFNPPTYKLVIHALDNPRLVLTHCNEYPAPRIQCVNFPNIFTYETASMFAEDLADVMYKADFATNLKSSIKSEIAKNSD